MGILKKKVGLYNGEDNKEISYTDPSTGTGKKLKSSILSGGGLGVSPWDTGNLTISVDTDAWRDIAADSISAWPSSERQISSRVVVPLGRNHTLEDERGRAIDYAKNYISQSIGDQLLSEGAIRFDIHEEFDTFTGDVRMIVEGTVDIPC